jgi:hypothetical protein
MVCEIFSFTCQKPQDRRDESHSAGIAEPYGKVGRRSGKFQEVCKLEKAQAVPLTSATGHKRSGENRNISILLKYVITIYLKLARPQCILGYIGNVPVKAITRFKRPIRIACAVYRMELGLSCRSVLMTCVWFTI